MNHIRERHRHMHMRSRGGDKRWFGFALLLIGIIVLLKKLDVFYFDFHTMWPWILILIGSLIGAKSRFRNNAWWILILVGAAHLIPVFTIFGVTSKALLIPVAMIVLGLMFIFRPSKKKQWDKWDKRCEPNNIRTVTNNDSVLNVDVTFGGHKEVVTSKDFKGGNISTSFGGAEINMMNADSVDKKINLNVKVTFGGVELIVPSHWEIKNEIYNTMGSVEDNRQLYAQTDNTEGNTVLYLTGNCSFGSIEIKSY